MYRIITIERQYASGGNEIGKKLARELDYRFQDHSILVEAAKRLEIPSTYVEDLEETAPGSIIFNLSQTVLGGTVKNTNNLPLATRLFLEEKQIIEELVEKGNCVIVGRCASAILKDRKDCLNVFIHADNEFRTKRAIEKEKISPHEVEAILRKNDKRRSNFYQTHTNWTWGDKEHFHMILDSGEIGIDKCIELLKITCK
ncbi:MAG: cytidylate kinase-like family protein [Lachnospiraceae bacterium]|nr:cytidylate kinase-like family protein [Lachnospiraceae bacterium]